MSQLEDTGLSRLVVSIKAWGRELGFQAVGIADIDLDAARARLTEWLERRYHGEMHYMAMHGAVRPRPDALVPGTVRVISARMDYLPRVAADAHSPGGGEGAFIARYALGRDYHKLVRARLRSLAARIERVAGSARHRVFADSAPVMEVELARKAGLGWRGKHTLLLSRGSGSYFFLGEIYTDLPLPVDRPVDAHCGTCARCIECCPTRAIVGPYQLDARRCISYLTIELRGSIPVDLRPLIGNRVYGCDDCQLACPWNRFARLSAEPDFGVRNGLDTARLVDLIGWDEGEFRRRMEGSAISRIGYERWLRNLAVGLGNAPTTKSVVDALRARAGIGSELVREHIAWALERHHRR